MEQKLGYVKDLIGSLVLRACLHQLKPQSYLNLNCIFSWLTTVPRGTSISQAEVNHATPQPHT